MKSMLVWFLAVMLLTVSVQAGNYSADWREFVKVIDEEYPFFELKGIKDDWRTAKKELTKRAETCEDDAAFLAVVSDALKCLRDGHAGFSKTRVPLPEGAEEFCLPLVLMPAKDGRVVTMSDAPQLGIGKGVVIERIDDQPARKFLDDQAEKLWRNGGSFSSPQRARLYAYRQALRSDKQTEHTIIYRTNGGEVKASFTNDRPARGWQHTYNLPDNLAQAEGDCLYGRLPSRAGYLYVRRIQGDKTAAGFRKAIGDLPDAKGWIVDLRGNGGGGYGEELLKAVGEMKPPIAVIIDAGCFSAGETFARDLQQTTKAKIFGSKSAGSSTVKRSWNFPSGVATITLSTRSRFRADKQPIEFNGIDPDVAVEAVPEEVAAGKNSEILRAEEYLADN